MDIEQKQAEHIDYFVKQASNLKHSALRNVIVEATSHPSLFAFAEILSVPNVLEVNREIYNHKKLREKLNSHQFKTYEEYGEDFVHILDGMFSFVLLETCNKIFISPRDAIGITPP